MVSNSVGISTCEGGRWRIEYYWRGRFTHSPRPFFESGTRELSLWPLDGILYHGRLYVAFSRVRRTRQGGPFGFEVIGVSLARVDNPQDRPDRWRITYRTLSEDKTASPGVSMDVDGDHLYLFTVLDDAAHKDHPLILTRIPLRALDDEDLPIEFLAKDGTWKRGLIPSDAAIVLEKGQTEMTVRYDLSERRWVAVQNKAFGSDEIVARTAPSLEGPWSAAQTIFRIPELDRTTAPDRDVFCYAAKEHPEFRKASGEMLITYACNSFDFGKLVATMALYRPRPVFVRLSDNP